ncbi:chitobiase/beta-hexosaminidase C-terminal domain-containing protein, partial [Akkermansiaceae bacterium]|nr:chitobiase/beta-hexosaminidase C-terminal domain-containing protein [Akkermansiaceae bacterium]
FDVDRGFFDAPFTVTISTATPGATIAYTTDGSEPSLSNGILAGGLFGGAHDFRNDGLASSGF